MKIKSNLIRDSRISMTLNFMVCGAAVFFFLVHFATNTLNPVTPTIDNVYESVNFRSEKEFR